MRASGLVVLWVAVSFAAQTQAALPEAKNIARRSEEGVSSSTGLVDYIASGLGYGSSAPSTSTEATTNLSSPSQKSLLASSSYLNSSTPISVQPMSTSHPAESSSSAVSSSTSPSASLDESSAAVSSSPNSSYALPPSLSTGSATPVSNSSTSRTVTAVYSQTHVSVVNSSEYPSLSSKWMSTGISSDTRPVTSNASYHLPSASYRGVHDAHNSSVPYAEAPSGHLPSAGSSSRLVASNSSAPYFVGSSGYLPSTESSSGHVAFNSSAPHFAGSSGYVSRAGSGLNATNSSLPYPLGPTASVSIHGTGLYPGNSTAAYQLYSSGTGRLLSTGYPFPNGSSATVALGTTGVLGGSYNHTNATATVPRTGFGYSYAQACNKASVDWSSKWLKDQIFKDTVTYPTPAYTPPPEADVYTLCDGIPRMRVNMTTTFTPYTRWSFTSPATLSGAPPQPNCTVVESDCSQLLSSYSIEHGVPASVSLGRVHTYMSYMYDDWPRCTTNTIASSKPGADCGIYGQGVELMYWPQVWAEGRGREKYCNALMGHSESITLGETIPGQPNTAVSDTYTFTSPTVYIKYHALSAMDWGDVPVGPTLYDGIIPVASTDVSTKLPYFWTNIPWEGEGGLLQIARETGIFNAKMEHGYTGINLNFADEHVPLTYPDLATPVPALPYYQRQVKMAFNDDTCWMGGCPTMMPWAYRGPMGPVLAIPDTMRFLAPEWESCSLPWGAMDDPPKALVTQTSIVTPTAAVADPTTTIDAANTVTTPASPSSPTALPAQQTGVEGGGSGDDARTSAQDDPAQPTSYDDDDDRNKPQKQEPTSVQQAGDDGEPAPATPVDNQSSRTSTQDAAGIIVSLLGNAGKTTTTGQSGATIAAVAVPANESPSDEPGHDDPEQPDNSDQSPADSHPQTPSNDGAGADGQENPPTPSANNAGATSDPSQDSSGNDNNTPQPNNGDSNPQPGPGSTGDDSGGNGDNAASPNGGNEPATISLGSGPLTVSAPEGTGKGVVVGSQTLTPGRSATQVDGHSVSVGQNGEVNVDGTSAGQVNLQPALTPTAAETGDIDGAAPITLAPGNVVTVAPWSAGGNEIIVGTQTISPGGSAAVVDGHTVSAAAGGQIAVDGSSAGAIVPQETSATRIPGPIPLGTQILTAHEVAGSSGALVLDGATLQEGGAVATLNGHVVSLGTHGKIHVDGALPGDDVGPSTVPLSEFSDSIAPLTLGSATVFARQTVLLDGRSAAIIDGTTVLAGSVPTVIDGTAVSLGNDGIVLQTAEATIPFSASSALITAGPDVLTASKTVLANGETVAVVGSQSLRLGGPAQTIDGDVFSLASNGIIELDDATTATFQSSAQLVTLDGHTLLARYTVLPDGRTAVVVDSQTLTLGGPAETVDGERLSLGPDGLVVGGVAGHSSTSFGGQTSGVQAAAKAQATATAAAARNVANLSRPSTMVMAFGLLLMMMCFAGY